MTISLSVTGVMATARPTKLAYKVGRVMLHVITLEKIQDKLRTLVQVELKDFGHWLVTGMAMNSRRRCCKSVSTIRS